MGPDAFELLTQKILRAARGKRPQSYLNEKLGFRSNRVAKWETLETRIAVDEAFALLACAGIDVDRLLRVGFSASERPREIGALLTHLGLEPAAHLEQALAISRRHAQRIVAGETSLAFADWLRVLGVKRAYPFLDELQRAVGEDLLAGTALEPRTEHDLLEQFPFASGAYHLQFLPEAKTTPLAELAVRRLNADLDAAKECFAALEHRALLRDAQAKAAGGSAARLPSLRISDPRKFAAAKAHWLDYNREFHRIRDYSAEKSASLTSFVTFHVARKDFEAIKALLVETIHQISELVSKSPVTEDDVAIGILNVDLIDTAEFVKLRG